jgi:signal transduction histidine kinase
VIDRGAGIPINQQQRVFERFFQVDPARTGFQHRRGTGLGLAIVKHAVKALGGTIGVESVWKQGTTMTVELPDCVITSSLAS